MGNFTAVLRKLTPSRLLAVLFLLFIGYVACAPFPQFLSNTKALITEGISPRNYIRSIDDQYSGMLSTEKDQPLLQNKGTYINLNGLMANLLAQPMMNDRVTLKNGHLASLVSWRYSQDAIESASENIARFAQRQLSQGKQFLFVMVPSQISKFEDLLPTGYMDTTNETADILLELLTQTGVPCLDLRETLHAEGMTQADAYFTTDHHWKPQTGFWAYTKILEALQQLGAVAPVDPFYTDSENYEFITYEKTFLGSSGKRTGIYYAGLDDSVFIRPKFDTEISVTIPERGLDLTGRYEDTAYNTDVETDYSHPDYFNENAYGLYGWGDTSLTQWRNEHAPENARVMLIGESFGNVPFSLMSLYFTSCDELDMRHYSGDFAEYYASSQPDIVILEVNVDQAVAEITTYPYFPET